MFLSLDEYNLLHHIEIVGIFNPSVFKNNNKTASFSKQTNAIILLSNNQKIPSPLRPATLCHRIQRQMNYGIKEIL
jgi:regulator of extracellular matrix RemA (YlzA/DUF370 family)